MTSEFSWQNSISLWPASFCIPRPNLPVTLGVSWLPPFAISEYQPPKLWENNYLFFKPFSPQFKLRHATTTTLWFHQLCLCLWEILAKGKCLPFIVNFRMEAGRIKNKMCRFAILVFLLSSISSANRILFFLYWMIQHFSLYCFKI